MAGEARPPKPKRRQPPRKPTPKLGSARIRAAGDPVSADDVELVRTKGTKSRGGGPGGEAWTIMAAGRRAGVVFVNVVDEPPLGPHASMQIFLNQVSRGRRIGRAGYLKACEASAHGVVYAHMRKSNAPSRRAAEEAGFVDATPGGNPQLVLKRVRAAVSPTDGPDDPAAATG